MTLSITARSPGQLPPGAGVRSGLLHCTACAGPGTLPQPVPPHPVTEPDKLGSALLSSAGNSRHQRNHQETLSRAARRERRHGCPGALAVRRRRSQEKPSAALRGDDGTRRRPCWGRTSARSVSNAGQHGGGGRGAPEGTEGCGRSTPTGRPSRSAAPPIPSAAAAGSRAPGTDWPPRGTARPLCGAAVATGVASERCGGAATNGECRARPRRAGGRGGARAVGAVGEAPRRQARRAGSAPRRAVPGPPGRRRAALCVRALPAGAARRAPRHRRARAAGCRPALPGVRLRGGRGRAALRAQRGRSRSGAGRCALRGEGWPLARTEPLENRRASEELPRMPA